MRGFPSSSESLHTLQIMRWHPAVPLMSGAPQLVGICVCIYKIRYCSRSLTKHVYNNNRNNKKSYCWKIQSHFRLVVSQFKRWRRRALRYCCFLPWGFCTSRNIFSGKKRSQYLLWLLLYSWVLRQWNKPWCLRLCSLTWVLGTWRISQLVCNFILIFRLVWPPKSKVKLRAWFICRGTCKPKLIWKQSVGNFL